MEALEQRRVGYVEDYLTVERIDTEALTLRTE